MAALMLGQDTPQPNWLPATVQSYVLGTTLTVLLDGGSVSVNATQAWNDTFAVGDRVWVTRVGTQLIVVGRQNYKGASAVVGEVTATDFKATGLTGAITLSRHVGGTASGAPTTGTFAVNDFVIDARGTIWVCTAAGSPGTWTRVLSGAYATGSAHFGTPPAGALILYQVFSAVPTLATGAFTISFPSAFPSGVVGVSCTGASSGAATQWLTSGTMSASSFAGTAFGTTGSTASGAVRVDCIAYGW